MDVARPVLVHRGHMGLRAVSLVRCKSVLRPLCMRLMHHAVTRDLGDDRRRGDREALGVALHDCFDVVSGDVRGSTVAVDEHGGWRGAGEGGDGGLHCAVGSLEDVDAVNALCVLYTSAAAVDW